MTEAAQYEYKATSKWCGFWGGWGSEKDIAEHIAQETRDSWHLIANENRLALWFWILPRPKMLFMYQRSVRFGA